MYELESHVIHDSKSIYRNTYWKIRVSARHGNECISTTIIYLWATNEETAKFQAESQVASRLMNTNASQFIQDVVDCYS